MLVYGKRKGKELTSLNVAMASTTSRVNAFPTPEVPIRTVGFIAWKMEKNVIMRLEIPIIFVSHFEFP